MLTRPSHASVALIGTGSLLFVAMLGSFAPTPLYPTYQRTWDASEADISLVFAAYAVGVLLVLFLAGGISDRIGRRPTLRLGIGTIALALVLLATAPSLPWLVLGRLVQGLGNGLVTGAGAAAMMETHPRGIRHGSNLNTLLLALGIAVGPVAAGVVATRLPHPLVTPYVVVGSLLLVPAALLARAGAPRLARVTDGRLIRPVRVPRSLWAPFAAGAGSIAITNICLGILGTFGPDIAADTGWRSPAAAGLFVSGVLAAVAITQVAGRRIPATTGMLIGGASSVLGWGLMTVGLLTASAAWVVPGAAAIGTGAGLGLLSSAAHIGAIAPAERRAEVYSAYLAAAFGTLATTSLALGPVVDAHGVATAAVVAGIASTAITVAMALLVRRGPSPRTDPHPTETPAETPAHTPRHRRTP